MSITILGAGSWGTALAWLLAGKQCPVTLWCRDPEQARTIAAEGRNLRYLPDHSLSALVRPTADLAVALAGARWVVLAIPAQHLRSVAEQVAPWAGEPEGWVVAAKGLEQATGRRLTEVLLDCWGAAARPQLAVLSGPNLSGEVVREVPTATVVAAFDPDRGRRLQGLFGTPFFRVYTNPDVPGVELGGALKNPIALAAGIGDGLGFGNNTKASLLTRGLAEMTRLGVAAGGRAATFSGLSGLGDLMATAHSPLSRNYRFGLALGRGLDPKAAQADVGQTAEGVATTDAACFLARRLGIEAPLMEELRQVLFAGKPARQAALDLLQRPHREEWPEA